MALAHSPRIVRDSLALYLDAANTKSYPGSGTTWKDICGKNNDGTLTNGPTFSSDNLGCIVLDGTNDYVSETSGLSDSLLQGNWSISFWVNFDVVNTSGSGNDRPLLHHGSSATRKGLHITNRSSVIRYGLYSDDIYSTQSLTADTWYNFVFTLNNTSYLKQIYINGLLDASGTGGGAYTGTVSNTRIGGRLLTFGLYFDGNISNVSAYNRVLTAAEVKQNYDALKGRFGL